MTSTVWNSRNNRTSHQAQPSWKKRSCKIVVLKGCGLFGIALGSGPLGASSPPNLGSHQAMGSLGCACLWDEIFILDCFPNLFIFPPSCFISTSLPFQTRLIPGIMGKVWQKSGRGFYLCFKKYFLPCHPADKDPFRIL